MRIYGSSPLYTYVELIFRCKRMFIISIILGTVIASAMVATRATTYNASILVSLTGDNPDLAAKLNGPRDPQTPAEKENSPARRKANRLLIWIKETPDFLEDVVKNAQLDKKYPNKPLSDLVRDVRKNIAEPTMLTEQYMSVKLTWNKPDEAETILNKLYSRFSEKTVNFETATVTSLRQIVQDQFKSAEIKADVLAKKRIAYQRDHLDSLQNALPAMRARFDQSRSQLEEAKLDLHDAEQRLSAVNEQLKGVLPQIVEQTKKEEQHESPTAALQGELDGEKSKLNTLLANYTPQHPKVVEQQKKIAALQQTIDEKKNEKQAPAPKSTVNSVITSSNPEYRDLKQQQRELERTVTAMGRKVSELTGIAASSEASLRKMPDSTIEWDKIDGDFQLQDQIRRNRKAQLAQLTLDEEREQKVKQNEVNLVVPPKAEKADSSGKLIVLYALGPLLGVVIAFCFSLLAETLDHTVRTPVEVEKYLNKPVLAVIPRMQTARDSRNKQLGGGTSKTSISS